MTVTPGLGQLEVHAPEPCLMSAIGIDQVDSTDFAIIVEEVLI